jgi:hypothetical protein
MADNGQKSSTSEGRGDIAEQPNALNDAERQMIEHEMGALSALIAKVTPRLDLNERPTENEIRAALLVAIDADPEVRELLQTLGTFKAGREEH